MPDILCRATAAGLRIYATDSTLSVEEARRRHDCRPLAAAALGRVMTGALLLSSTLKDTEERVTVKISGDGPLGNIVADAGNFGVRGCLNNPKADLPAKNGKIDVSGGVGKGQISITRFTGLKTPFTGSAELISGEIAADITNYLFVSEQTPTSVALGVLVGADGKIKTAGGFFVQAMPEADDGILETIENNIGSLPPVTLMLENGLCPADIIRKICGEVIKPVIHDQLPVKFFCGCSYRQVAGMLAGLSKSDLSAIAEDQETEVRCHFCGDKYLFSQNDIKNLANI